MRLAAALLCMTLPFAAVAQDAPRQITVTGYGSAAAAPDMAMISVGVTARDSVAQAAMDQTSQVTAAILARMAAMGIEPRDLQTSDLSLRPIYDNGNTPQNGPVVVGYEASNLVSVRVRALDSLGQVIGAALSDGANELGGLSFMVANPAPLLDDARRAAVADARARATLYAEAAGVALGPVLSISEAGGYEPMPKAEMMRSAAYDAPIAAGETGYSAQVTVVYGIAD
ncbi:MAG: SIMPL domain-containing protein [Roseivivax sp.]|nr:SIMPL domain-containing protein [Roseivivax sp.]